MLFDSFTLQEFKTNAKKSNVILEVTSRENFTLLYYKIPKKSVISFNVDETKKKKPLILNSLKMWFKN